MASVRYQTTAPSSWPPTTLPWKLHRSRILHAVCHLQTWHQCLYVQGVFVRRHQIEKEDGSGNLSPADLAVGQTVTIYGRTYILIDADAFTRNW